MSNYVTYQSIDLIGKELFRKKNEKFFTSNLSAIMSRIFLAANKNLGVTEITDECYMKSAAMPNKIFYIYSSAVEEKSDKLYDIVNLNGEICIWIYSNNMIDMIGENPVLYINILYDRLLNTFTSKGHGFASKEKRIAKTCMIIRLIHFLHETYGVLNLESCKKDIIKNLPEYTEESILEFIDDVIEQYTYNDEYFKDRHYLTSYMILKTKDIALGKNINSIEV